MNRLGNALRRRIAVLPRRPIFVLGMQKSGTTAIAALLARRTGLEATLDLRHEHYELVLPRVRAGAVSFRAFVARNRRDFARPLVKEPMLTPFFDELHDRFPQARFVFVLRDPRDTIRSILNRLDLPGNQDRLDAAQWATVSSGWQTVLDNRWLGLPDAPYVESLAHRWNLSAETYRAHQAHGVLIRYETFMQDKQTEIDRLLTELNLDRKAEIKDLLDHPFQPAGDASTSWTTFFGPDNLARIETVCGPWIKRLGY